jgi:hypothetical protein
MPDGTVYNRDLTLRLVDYTPRQTAWSVPEIDRI